MADGGLDAGRAPLYPLGNHAPDCTLRSVYSLSLILCIPVERESRSKGWQVRPRRADCGKVNEELKQSLVF
jgi:hypothetical protein